MAGETYKFRQMADAAEAPLNTLRSYYERGHFRVVGGELKKGRGIAADFTKPDVLCSAVANKLVQLGMHPKNAFEVAIKFAYSSNGIRMPGPIFDPRERGDTLLLTDPVSGEFEIIAENERDSRSRLFPRESVRQLRLNPIVARVTAKLLSFDQLAGAMASAGRVDA